MPLLTIPNSFTPFTKILSAQVNANFTAISTLLNTTGLDDTNLQNAGISLTKLKTTGFSSGQFIGYNGSAFVATSNPLTAQFNVVLGSAAQVSSGVATHSTFASVTQADGDRILILPGYATTENWSVTKKVLIAGLGNTSVITGTVTFTNTADYSLMTQCRVTDTITLNSGADGIVIDNIFLASGKSFTDNGSGNLLTALQET